MHGIRRYAWNDSSLERVLVPWCTSVLDSIACLPMARPALRSLLRGKPDESTPKISARPYVPADRVPACYTVMLAIQ
jgi:hypothetical protein